MSFMNKLNARIVRHCIEIKFGAESKKKSTWREKCHAFIKVHVPEMVKLVDS